MESLLIDKNIFEPLRLHYKIKLQEQICMERQYYYQIFSTKLEIGLFSLIPASLFDESFDGMRHRWHIGLDILL